MTDVPVTTDSNEKLWAVLSHASLFIGAPFLLPLIIYLVKKDAGGEAAQHAKEALNFHISTFIYTLLALPLCFFCVGFFALIGIGLASAIFSIVACIKASEGAPYRYPLTLRLVP